MSGRGHGVSAARSGSFGPKTEVKSKGRDRFRGRKPEPVEETESDAPEETETVFRVVGKNAAGEEMVAEKEYKTEAGAQAFLDRTVAPEGTTDWAVVETTVPAK